MTGAADLERAYRRWLRWYPKEFRREHEDEILAVLLEGAREGLRRPELLDCLDLLRSALWLRLRPRVPRSDRPTFNAIRLLCIGAVVELTAVLTIVATMGEVRANALARDPGFTERQWHAAVAGQLEPNVVGGTLAIVFWLWMAWSIGRGHRWTRIPLAFFFGLNLYGLCIGLANGAATFSWPDLAAGVFICLFELAAVATVFRLKPAALPGRTPIPSSPRPGDAERAT